MKRFVWRLQRVLDIKKKEEQIRKAELLKLTDKLTRTQSELLTEKRKLKAIIDDLKEKQPRERLSKQEFFLRFSAATDERIRRLESKVRELESLQREKIKEVLKVRRFKEGLKRLRGEAKTQFIKEQEKLEQKELDEAAAISFARKTMQPDKIGGRVG